ncbi:Callose synthase [Arachis hypogaea]|nr:Callose synthase [Arachis hypogaea]
MFHYDLLDETQNKLDYILSLSLSRTSSSAVSIFSYHFGCLRKDTLPIMQLEERDNVRNQREHLILLLANSHIRLHPKPEPLNMAHFLKVSKRCNRGSCFIWACTFSSGVRRLMFASCLSAYATYFTTYGGDRGFDKVTQQQDYCLPESNVPAIDVLGGDSHKQIGEISEPEEDGNTNNPDFKPEGVGVFEVILIELVTILQVRCHDEA